MKLNYILIPFLFSVLSCARMTLTQKIENERNDLFKAESYLRYTKSRIDNSESEIYQCYQADYTKAFQSMKSKVKANINNPEYWNTYGICYFLKSDYPKADYFFKLALSYSKNKFLPALNNLGISKLKQNHKLEALDYFSQIKHQGPHYKVPLFNQAQIYLEYNMPANALNNLYLLYKYNNHDPEILVSLAVGHILLNEMSKANDYLNKLTQTRSNAADVIFYKAVIAYQNKDYKLVKNLIESEHFTNTLVIKRYAKKLLKIANDKLITIELNKKSS